MAGYKEPPGGFQLQVQCHRDDQLHLFFRLDCAGVWRGKLKVKNNVSEQNVLD